MVFKILCGISDQQQSELAAEAAIDLARRLQAKLWFFMANPMVLPGRGPVVYLYSEDHITRYLREALGRANAAGIFEVTCDTRKVSSIAEAIVAYANELAVDYVVIGSDSRPRRMRWFQPSISQSVISLADVPILVVKQKRY